MEFELKYYKAPENPLYEGEYEIVHKNCPLSTISDNMQEDIYVSVLEYSKKKTHRLRFETNEALPRQKVRNLLKSADKLSPIQYAAVWVNGGTTFELKIEEPTLQTVEPIRSLPFGALKNYVAHPAKETFKLIAPGDAEKSGKERLLETEEMLKEVGDTQLLGFKRFDREDAIREANIYKRFSSSFWLNNEGVSILQTSIDLGYFETPKRITLEVLSKELGISKLRLNEKLRSINRSVLERFIKVMGERLPP